MQMEEQDPTNCSRKAASLIEASTFHNLVLAEPRDPMRSVSPVFVFSVCFAALAAIWMVGNPRIVRVAIPGLFFMVALCLYFVRPVLYVQYTLWIWFLTPLLRRLVDLRFGYMESNVVLLAPFLATAVAGLTLILPATQNRWRIPKVFILCTLGIVHGFVIGMLLNPSAEAVYGLLNWLSPLLFGLHIYFNWSRYRQYQKAICNTFLMGAFVLGLYGLFQFFAPPAWDTYWLTNVQYQSLNPAFGQPEPFAIRVWSTLHSPTPFANVMMAALFLLLVVRSPLKFPAAVAGGLSFLLSMVRTAWVSWFAGLFFILRKTQLRLLVQIVVIALLLLVALWPLASDPRVSPVIGDRIKTFTDLGHDESALARLNMYKKLGAEILDHPFGFGLSNMTIIQNIPIDSGLVLTAFSLGWTGTLLFLFGIVSLYLSRYRINSDHDEFIRVGRAILFAFLLELLSFNIFVNVTGLIFWMFIGLELGAFQFATFEQSQQTFVEELKAA
jgi:hypothetical protein